MVDTVKLVNSWQKRPKLVIDVRTDCMHDAKLLCEFLLHEKVWRLLRLSSSRKVISCHENELSHQTLLEEHGSASYNNYLGLIDSWKVSGLLLLLAS